MKLVLKIIGSIVGILVLVMALQMAASESGEVVVVTTADPTGSTEQTRLWVVDYQGSAWLRSGSEAAGWYQRILANSEVVIERGDQVFTAHAAAHPNSVKTINDLMAQKYGWADSYIGMLFGRDNSIPIKLEAL